jgi:septal ring factor EnvC (AmiA/AmiB activator)
MGGDVLPGARARAVRVVLSIAAAAAVSSLVPFAAAQNSRAEQQRLQAVRKEIKAVEQQLARQVTERDENARALRAAETDIAAAAGKLEGTGALGPVDGFGLDELRQGVESAGLRVQ